jgi:hypothetical protein
LLKQLEGTSMIARRATCGCVFAHNLCRTIYAAAFHLRCELQPSTKNNQHLVTPQLWRRQITFQDVGKAFTSSTNPCVDTEIAMAKTEPTAAGRYSNLSQREIEAFRPSWLDATYRTQRTFAKFADRLFERRVVSE